MPVSPRTRAETSKFTFYLGVHRHKFLQETSVPLFISRRILARVKYLRSYTTWALDSDGFTELSLHGKWVTSPGMYAAQAKHWYDNVPGLQWCDVQDWMCEPIILGKTGLTVADHQRLTIKSYLDLRRLQPTVPWMPVLQGYRPDEYINHLRQYERAGINLTALPIVGVGSVCRRQSKDVDEAETIIRLLHGAHIKLHAFGFKATGLSRCARMLTSADSMSWSYRARVEKMRLPGCTHRGYCNNCLRYALQWRADLLEKIGRG